jgi:hypothetical protein
MEHKGIFPAHKVQDAPFTIGAERSIVQTAPLGVGTEVVDCPHDVKNNWQDGRHIWQTQK